MDINQLLDSAALRRDLGGRFRLLSIPIALAALLVVISQYNFLLFHTLAEFFAIIVAITMSIVAWQMYPLIRNNYLMFLGCGYFWVAALDLLHALSYTGMGIFQPDTSSSDLTAQLWIVARYCEALLLLSAPLFLNRHLNRVLSFALFGLIISGLCLWVFSGNSPAAFIEGQGLTPFKVYSEYLIISLLILALYYLWNRRARLEAGIFRLMALSILLTMCAELAFTFYHTLFGLFNIVGHIFKLFSFFLIFIAVVRTPLREPLLAMARGASSYD
ncbi:MAG: hypothetical protein KAJ19_01500, partial [Gammaproteobacteria bacterium]|nr:hypothetical protein [Gammaproteobacteria bacterium]